MKKLLFGILTCSTAAVFAQDNILDARTNYSIGQTVTVSGVVTNGGELGNIRYLQDGTAGIAAYGGPATNANIGDTVSATGELLEYNGLLELSPTSAMVIHGNAVNPPAPLTLSISNIGEQYEGQLLRIDNVTINTTETNFAGNTNYTMTDGTNDLTFRINNASPIVGQSIPSGTVSITGLLGQYNSFQLLPRFVSDIVPYVAPDKEINILMAGESFLTGTEYVVGNSTATTVSIENLGATQNLTINGITVTGTGSADFSVTGAPATVAPGATETFTLNFTPSTTGSILATLEIQSDDADEATYTIDLYAVGTDDLATEPTSPGSNLTFPVNEAYALTGSFDVESSAEKYIVLWSKNGAPSTAPTDGNSYQRGDVVGNATVAYVGPASAFTPRHIIANTNYSFAVYSFNGPNGFENYSANSLTGAQTSTGENMGNYYNGIDTDVSSFVTDLSSLINNHNVFSYGNYRAFVMNQFEIRDTTQGRSVVTCALSGENKIFEGNFDWTATGYSREHTFAHSWMPTWPADEPYPGLPEYSDYHNLYPANLNKANTPRSNLPLGEVTGNVLFEYLGGKVGQNGDGATVYEPRDVHKGNAARAMMYLSIAYNGVSGNNWSIPSNQDQNLMKAWHFNDLPDNYEIARNEYIYSVQNNRNPFVDHPEYMCFIDFHTMNYLSDTTGCMDGTTSVEETNLERIVSVFPNPSKDEFYVSLNDISEETSIVITDVNGKIVRTISKAMLSNTIDTRNWSEGLYFVSINSGNQSLTRKMIVK